MLCLNKKVVFDGAIRDRLLEILYAKDQPTVEELDERAAAEEAAEAANGAEGDEVVEGQEGNPGGEVESDGAQYPEGGDSGDVAANGDDSAGRVSLHREGSVGNLDDDYANGDLATE